MSENQEKWASSFMQLEREHETTDLGNSKGIYCLSCTNNFDPCHHKIVLVWVTGNQSNDNENDLQFDEIGNLGKKSENKFEKTNEKMDWDNFDDEAEAELRCDEDIKELGSSQDESEDPLYTLDEESFGDSNSE